MRWEANAQPGGRGGGKKNRRLVGQSRLATFNASSPPLLRLIGCTPTLPKRQRLGLDDLREKGWIVDREISRILPREENSCSRDRGIRREVPRRVRELALSFPVRYGSITAAAAASERNERSCGLSGNSERALIGTSAQPQREGEKGRARSEK